MTLYVLASPIGNLDDLSDRAKKILAQVDVVACEDTRRSAQLLNHLGLKKPLIRCDQFAQKREAPRLVERLKNGGSVALLTDAGTPGVSDPGVPVVQEALASGVTVVPIPGPSAMLAALVGSGLPMDRFLFLGFLPRRPGRIKKELAKAGTENTIVFFESVFRVKKTLSLAQQVFGDVPAAVGRELTKVHEEFIRGTIGQILQNLENRELKGEATVVISPQIIQ